MEERTENCSGRIEGTEYARMMGDIDDTGPSEQCEPYERD